MDNGDRRSAGEARPESTGKTGVDLDGEHPGRHGRQRRRQPPVSGADINDDIGGRDVRNPHELVAQLVAGQEVLAYVAGMWRTAAPCHGTPSPWRLSAFRTQMCRHRCASRPAAASELSRPSHPAHRSRRLRGLTTNRSIRSGTGLSSPEVATESDEEGARRVTEALAKPVGAGRWPTFRHCPMTASATRSSTAASSCRRRRPSCTRPSQIGSGGAPCRRRGGIRGP